MNARARGGGGGGGILASAKREGLFVANLRIPNLTLHVHVYVELGSSHAHEPVCDYIPEEQTSNQTLARGYGYTRLGGHYLGLNFQMWVASYTTCRPRSLLEI